MGKPKQAKKSIQQLIRRPNQTTTTVKPAQIYPRTALIRFRFKAPLHLSNIRPDDYGVSERVVHSDTLTAAIFQAWAMLGRTDLIPGNSSSAAEPGFVVSSLFPFYENRQAEEVEQRGPVYFWPKPFFRNSNTNNVELKPGEAKKYKKVQYVDTAHFLAYLNQTAPPDGGLDNLHGAFQCKPLPKDYADFLTSDVQTRLTKPRNESEPTPYYIERLYFRYDSGLWCLIQYDNADAEKHVKAALTYLADEGIGTDRSVGNGQFEPDFCDQPDSFRFPTSGSYGVNLSLFCPEDYTQLAKLMGHNGDQPDPAVRYELVQRGGWLSEPHNTLRKRSVQMFRPGSLFRLLTPAPYTRAGRLVDIKPVPEDDKLAPHLPIHPVWRDGRALWLPVNLK